MKPTLHTDQHEQEFRRALAERGIALPRGVELMRALLGSARMLEVLADHNLQQTGLSLSRLRLLLWLEIAERCGNRAGVSPSRLSHYQHISKNTMSSLLSSLEEQGLLERALSREDKRSFNIRLTKTGRELIRATLPQHGADLNEAFAALTLEEQKTLLQLLQKFRQSLIKQIADKKLESYKT